MKAISRVKCTSNECQIRHKCFRFTCESKKVQKYSNFYKGGECEYFKDNNSFFDTLKSKLTEIENKIYTKCFRHFSQRLSERYNILITFEDYLIFCKTKLGGNIEIDYNEKGKVKSQIGYILIGDERVKVVKSVERSGLEPLITVYK